MNKWEWGEGECGVPIHDTEILHIATQIVFFLSWRDGWVGEGGHYFVKNLVLGFLTFSNSD